MLLIDRHEHRWPDDLMPIGEGGAEKEPFATWWTRFSERFPDLDPRIVEQWVYRHWRHSPFSFLDVFAMRSRLENWTSEKILSDVYSDDPMVAGHDYKVFHELGETRTARPFNATGTWDYPIVVLETPAGVIDFGRSRPDVRYMLIEGHKRRRYLNAKVDRGEALSSHDIFVLTSA